MSEKKTRFTNLSLGLVLAALFVLLATILAIKTASNVNREQKQDLASSSTQTKEQAPLDIPLILPQLKDFEQGENLSGQNMGNKEQEQEVSLKDLPLQTADVENRLQQEQRPPEGEGQLKTQPSVEEMKELQQRGLVIF